MRVNQGMVRTRGVCVGGNRFRHVRCSCLEQSLNSKSVLHVVGRKVLSLENSLRLDVVGFQEVTQENRDVDRVVAREFLAALDGRATQAKFSSLPSSTASITVWYAARSEALGEARRVARRTDCRTSSIERSPMKFRVW